MSLQRFGQLGVAGTAATGGFREVTKSIGPANDSCGPIQRGRECHNGWFTRIDGEELWISTSNIPGTHLMRISTGNMVVNREDTRGYLPNASRLKPVAKDEVSKVEDIWIVDMVPQPTISRIK